MHTLMISTTSSLTPQILRPKSSVPTTITHATNLAPPTKRTDDLALRRRDLLLMSAVAAAAPPPAISAAAEAEYPIKLDGVVRRVVARQRKSKSKEKEEEEEEEVLVIEGIEFDPSVPVKFDVYVNDDYDDRGGPEAAEFAGCLVNVPHGHGRGMKTCLRLAITDLLADLGADDDDSIVVTLVPKIGAGLVTISNIGIQFLS